MRRFVLSFLIVAAPAFSQEVQDEGSGRRKLPADILAGKREGAYFTGVPAVAYSPDSGLIYGAVIFHFDNGAKTDDRFDYTPYLRKTSLLAVQSTKGLRQVKIDLDFPQFLGSGHRLKPSLYYTNNIAEQYFGTTGRTMENLRFPAEVAAEAGDGSQTAFESYEEELGKRRQDGRTWFRYNQYVHRETEAILIDEVNAGAPWFFVKVGMSGASVSVQDYSGKETDALDPGNTEKEVKAIMATTKLQEDDTAGAVTGFDGGTVNTMEFGVSVDTRDFEPDPSSGIYSVVDVSTARKELGSDWNFARYKINLRGFYSPLKALTLGAQAQHQWAEGEVPFWKLPSAGGRNSLKGYRVSRFKSRAASWFNTEARWRAYTAGSGSQTFAFVPLIFADFGQVYDEPGTFAADGWRRGSGTGLRLVWNQATVIGIEKPLQGEEKSLYVNINHIF
jgi:outer membrane protein assembly factor BamA